MPVFEHRAPMPSSQAALWAWHDSPEAFVRIMPEWERLTPVQLGGLEDGQQTRFKMRWGPCDPCGLLNISTSRTDRPSPTRWSRGHLAVGITSIGLTPMEPNQKWWTPCSGGFPSISFSGWTAPITVMPRLRSMFRFRSDRVRGDLRRIEETADLPRRRVLVSGSTGLIGTQLCAFLFAAGTTWFVCCERKPCYPSTLQNARWCDGTTEPGGPRRILRGL
ncbi:MAG: hypothetical protein CM15mP128_2810 [Methanobacteriota archaeon]|nr:MAG: hypothetical protein CM15mP128_2810 [Euryarchaeota archaeon]